MRVPVVYDINSRDGTLTKGSKIVNGYAEKGQEPYVFKRPAVILAENAFDAFGGGMFTPPRDTSISYVVGGQTLYKMFGSSVPIFSANSTPAATGSESGIPLSFKGSLFLLSGTQLPAFDGVVYRKNSITGTWLQIATGVSFLAENMVGTVAAVYGNRLWVIASSGVNQQIYNSVDGITWNIVDLNSLTGAATLRGIVSHGGFLWILARNAAGTAIVMYKSSAPTTVGGWSSVGSTNLTNNYSQFGLVSFLGAMYATAGFDGASNLDDVFSSTDGVAWTTVSATPGYAARRAHACFVYNNTLVVAAGTSGSGTTWMSPDGTTWTQGTTIGSGQAWGVTYQDTALVLVNSGSGGVTGTMYYSASGAADFVAVSIGTTAGSGIASFASTDTGSVIMIKFNDIAYTYDGTTLTQITDSDYPANTVRGVVYLNGIFYVMDTDGNIWGSAEDDPTSWTSTNLVVAEFEPDGGVCLAKMVEYAVALGTYTVELFYDAGIAPPASSLAPVQNGLLLIGCAHQNSVAQTESSLMWVAQQKAQGTTFHKGRFVVSLEGMNYKRISTPDIERILDADSLIDVYADVLTTAGHMFYILSLMNSGITLVYDFRESLWYQWSQSTANSAITISALSQTSGLATATATSHGLSDGDQVTVSGAAQSGYNLTVNITRVNANSFTYPVASATVSPATGSPVAASWTQGVFDVSGSCYFAGKQIVQFRTTGDVYQLDPTLAADTGGPIDFQMVTAKLDADNNKPKFNPRLEIIGDKVSSTGLIRYSDDDFTTWSTYRRLDMIAQRTATRRLGRFFRRAYQFRHTLSAKVRLSAIELDLEQGG